MSIERMESQESPTNELLKNKYDLHKSPEVTAAAEATFSHTNEKVPQDPLIRIENYLDRLDHIIHPPVLDTNPEFDRQERNITMLKGRLYDRFVIKPEDIPESYWENQRRIIRERGQEGDLAMVDWEELKRQNTEAVISDQRASLDEWIEYFASPDSSYIPNALKYYAFRSVLSMGEYDKEKRAYPQRSKGTTKPFPDLNREALAYVLDALNKKYQGAPIDTTTFEEEEQKQFEKLLQSENFAKLYAWAMEKVTPADEQGLSNTQGKWIKYVQGSNHIPLVHSLQGHGTGWCTAGESTAASQIQGGDFYVYYSNDQEGNSTIPRVAIRMEGGNIAEVRGIAPDQNLDPFVAPIVEKKLEEFSDGKLYLQKVADMKHLTNIDYKIQKGEALNRSDLRFLYEIDNSIQGFGYSRDPRIQEMRSKRNREEDMQVIFDCGSSQIARSIQDIKADTKAYVGALTPGIFDRLQKYNIEHVYTSFPEGKIQRNNVEIGTKSKEQLLEELRQKNTYVSTSAEEMIRNPSFTIRETPQLLPTVRLKVRDLGFQSTATTDQIYTKASELGLDLCPAEVGPNLRLRDENQRIGSWYFIGMKPITDLHGNPCVFELNRGGGGPKLHAYLALPDGRWFPENDFVFALRTPSTPEGVQGEKDTSDPQSLSFLRRILNR